MRESTKARCRIRQGYDALDLIGEAGELIGLVLERDDWNGYNPHDPVDCAYMDLIMECAWIGHSRATRPRKGEKWVCAEA
jgi:hypothetical protein